MQKNIVGVDEAGRGPLAGPVIAAAVILDPNHAIPGLQDSKKLTDKMRRQLAEEIQRNALAYSIGRAEVLEIEQLNIHHATLLAMQRAVLALPQDISVGHVIIDGLFCPELPYSCEAIVGGDISQPVISAASILAKVFRDNEMIHLDQIYPGYGFANHKGYSTKMHTDALARLGVTDIHRRLYGPVKALL